MTWRHAMLKKHGERLFFMALSLILCLILFFLTYIKAPIQVEGMERPFAILTGTITTVLIGLVMICFNKARSAIPPDAIEDPTLPVIEPSEPKLPSE